MSTESDGFLSITNHINRNILLLFIPGHLVTLWTSKLCRIYEIFYQVSRDYEIGSVFYVLNINKFKIKCQ